VQQPLWYHGIGSTVVTYTAKYPFLDMTNPLIAILARRDLVKYKRQQLADKSLLYDLKTAKYLPKVNAERRP
jgi:hypothetical protein